MTVLCFGWIDSNANELDAEISAARRAATRERRMEETARLAAANERANEWRPKDRSSDGPGARDSV